jgi:hypothetical protein
MISVIICSINKVLALQVQKNIADTIGVVWEPIIIDNTKHPESITHVYNIGAAKAKYDIVCFVHEDILFQTQNWGVKLVNYFKNDASLGLVGVAGSKYKSKTPSGWFSGIDEIECCNITHIDSADHQQKMYFNPSPGSLTQEAIVWDGVLLCCPKKVWEDIRFDDILLKGFHLYDLDFSFRVAEKYKVMVTFEIDLIHLTQGGSFGNEWVEYTLLWHKKMHKRLPASTPGINLKIKEFEKIILKRWLIRLKHERISFYNQLNWLWNIKIWLHISAWPFVFLFLTKKYFKKLSR